MSKHQQLHPFCRITYWTSQHTAAASDENWARCMVSPLGMYTYGEQWFENTQQGIASRDALVVFLEKSYELGRLDAKREIREVLGVKEPRP